MSQEEGSSSTLADWNRKQCPSGVMKKPIMLSGKAIISSSLLWLVIAVPAASAFVTPRFSSTDIAFSSKLLSTATSKEQELQTQKRKLLELVGKISIKDPVLADPITKEPIEISAPGFLMGGEMRRRNVQLKIRSPSNAFKGSSDTYFDLLEPTQETDLSELPSFADNNRWTEVMRLALPVLPAPLRGPLAATLTDGEIIPMRDLFTNPAVSFAYERGWRQQFVAAGFPGIDVESQMAMDYFAPAVARSNSSVIVDMSCASGMFTRRFAATDKYSRVLGCDYSPSMLREARRRINADRRLSEGNLKKTKLDLVRLDACRISMQSGSVDGLHAGAAMHCWPDLDAAASEIYRVLKPGGRYFATTFLSQYFRAFQAIDGSGATFTPAIQAFQYFESVDTLRSLLERGGFEREKIMIEVLGRACVVIRAEK